MKLLDKLTDCLNVAPFFLKVGHIVLIPASKMLESDTIESKATGIRVTFLVLFCSLVSDMASLGMSETNVGKAMRVGPLKEVTDTEGATRGGWSERSFVQESTP